MMLQSFKKTQLRFDMREKLKGIDFSLISEKSNIINKKLAVLKEIQEAETIFIFVSLFKNGVQTFDLINYLLAKGKSVVVTKVIKNDAQIVKLSPKVKVLPGKYEFVGDVYDGKIDIALVPGLAFSEKGKRIGDGGGYYDRFLAQHTDILKIGVCFSFQMLVEEEIPMDSHDIFMNKIIHD